MFANAQENNHMTPEKDSGSAREYSKVKLAAWQLAEQAFGRVGGDMSVNKQDKLARIRRGVRGSHRQFRLAKSIVGCDTVEEKNS